MLPLIPDTVYTGNLCKVTFVESLKETFYTLLYTHKMSAMTLIQSFLKSLKEIYHILSIFYVMLY